MRATMAERFGIRFEIVSITPMYDRFLEALEPVFGGAKPDVTEENMQSRLRGVTLMALSNKTGALVLTTGNKSELAVGYCTLYGDMCGGLAVISDVPKTLVYKLSRIANRRHNNAIPENVFIKPPSAELRPDQKDTDSLARVRRLDRILKGYVEEAAEPQRDCRGAGRGDRSGARHHQQSRPKRVQAAAGRPRTEGHNESVRHRTPLPDRAEVHRMKYVGIFCFAVSATFLVSQSTRSAGAGRPAVAGGFLLNSGWRIQPAGRQIPLDTFPMSTALSKDGKYLLVLNGGYNPPSISVLADGHDGGEARVPVPDGWLGLTFSPDGKIVYVGGGSRASVFEFTCNDGKLEPARTFEIVPEDKRAPTRLHRRRGGVAGRAPDLCGRCCFTTRFT